MTKVGQGTFKYSEHIQYVRTYLLFRNINYAYLISKMVHLLGLSKDLFYPHNSHRSNNKSTTFSSLLTFLFPFSSSSTARTGARTACTTRTRSGAPASPSTRPPRPSSRRTWRSAGWRTRSHTRKGRDKRKKGLPGD